MNATALKPVAGIHHISAICGDPQRNIDFYVGLLGLRLVKRTVNFDDPGSWHLYYGDGLGTPGTLLTFFAWTAVPPLVFARGRAGTGQVSAASFALAPGSLDFWIDRLAGAAVDFDGPAPRFDEQVLTLRDPEGLAIELVAGRDGPARAPWVDAPVPAEHALHGLAGATLRPDGCERSAGLLTRLGFRDAGKDGTRIRFELGDDAGGAAIDLLCDPELPPGRMGIGAVHHIAWRTSTAEAQRELREALLAAGFDVTAVLDRKYFQSVYFHEPGGVLFEIATDGPGFGVDETAAELGARLQLPAWLEERRERIVARLPELRPPRPAARYRDW